MGERKLMPPEVSRKSVRYWWDRSLSCAEALFTILNRAAGIELIAEEQAAHALAGGVLNSGRACGMLWGAALAAGAQAQARFERGEVAAVAALQITARMQDEFRDLIGAADCREIIGQDLTTVFGKVGYVTSGAAVTCTRLALKWSPEAHDLIQTGLADFDPAAVTRPLNNCAVMTMRFLAGPLGLDPERTPGLTAGFAGGLGLKGNTCGALAAGIFALALNYYHAQGRQARDSRLRALAQEIGLGKGFTVKPAQLRAAFLTRFRTDQCRELVSRGFASPEDLSTYLADGGCKEVIEFVAVKSQSF